MRFMLDVSVRLVDPLDPAILSRLPGPQVSVPEAFPVLVRVEPTPLSALTFAGVVSVSFHTHNLALLANSPLALYSGPADGPLRDITRSVGIGSYRAGGSGGGFGIATCSFGCEGSGASEFMIVADTRPIETIVLEKFEILATHLNDDLARTNEEMATAFGEGTDTMRRLVRVKTVGELQRRFDQARTQYGRGATVSAVAEVTGLLDYLKTRSGGAIPDVWRAHDTRVNDAGLRRAALDTLRFSLLKAPPRARASATGPVPTPPTPEPPPTHARPTDANARAT